MSRSRRRLGEVAAALVVAVVLAGGFGACNRGEEVAQDYFGVACPDSWVVVIKHPDPGTGMTTVDAAIAEFLASPAADRLPDDGYAQEPIGPDLLVARHATPDAKVDLAFGLQLSEGRWRVTGWAACAQSPYVQS